MASTSAAAKEPLHVTELSSTGVLTIRMNNPKKLNAWTLPMMDAFFGEIDAADARDDVNGVVITGTGEYYCAGADLAGVLTSPMLPSTLVATARDENEKIFRHFLDFSKPIVAAVNGPAVGGAVTTAVLCDEVVASERAKFSTPFAKVGLPPEGCSSVTFAERMGTETAERMLGPENWTPTAEEALAAGLIHEVVQTGGDNAAVVARAVTRVEELVAAGGGRRYDEAERQGLKRVNAVESADLANMVVSARFLDNVVHLTTRKKRTAAALVFRALRVTLPLWQPAPVKPRL